MDCFCVCFYTLLFTLEINAIEQILENFVHVLKNSYLHFFTFHVIFKILSVNLKKKLKFGSLAIEDKVFPYTLNIDW